MVWVVHTGGTSSTTNKDGTISTPVTLAAALTIADQCASALSPVTIRIEEGVYSLSSPITLLSHVTLEGGLQYAGGSTWTKTNTVTTELRRVGTYESVPVSNQKVFVALRAESITNWALQDLTITTITAPFASFSHGASTYGIHIVDSNSFSITRCDIRPGTAAAGYSGGTGPSGLSGSTGGTGGNGDEEYVLFPPFPHFTIFFSVLSLSLNLFAVLRIPVPPHSPPVPPVPPVPPPVPPCFPPFPSPFYLAPSKRGTHLQQQRPRE